MEGYFAPEIINFVDEKDRFKVDYKLSRSHTYLGKSYSHSNNHSLLIKKEDIIWGGSFDGYEKKVERISLGTTCKVYSYREDSRSRLKPTKDKIWEPW
jgi:hypothetical protein